MQRLFGSLGLIYIGSLVISKYDLIKTKYLE